ncbi:hypothetical protein KFL_001820060 [Klebsormidium nitens]|uniref:Uncharacterized protein n=1 Tax=Klebsormidium nitens TaxID=105231 RepID=A0A1Y1I1B1_KLENI|nr:hypothetical protein KFL_001820060 [Klebsormidium nitens]|eukprot:GAQ84253.1 hypothetical protein KFL_001820060 [Klebsormidium nitens]
MPLATASSLSIELQAAQRGTAPEEGASELAEVDVGTHLLRFSPNQSANVVQRQLASGYGPGLLAYPKHVKMGHKLAVRETLPPKAAQRGTAPEGEDKEDWADVKTKYGLIRFTANLPANDVQQKLKNGYGPGVLIRASDSLAENDTLVAGSYEYIQAESMDQRDLDELDLTELQIKILTDLETLKCRVEKMMILKAKIRSKAPLLVSFLKEGSILMAD